MTVIPERGLRRELGSQARPLLEREGELAALSALIEAARSGDGRLVLVEGPAGIGKTRLLAEARSLATEFEVLSARAGELESDFAYGIVRQLFEGALATASADVRGELLSGAAALAAPLFAVALGDSGEAATETSFAMLHGLYWLAANFALRTPTLIAVDDLHWADEESLRWLGYLARRLEGLPMLVVAATRPREPAPTPAAVAALMADPLATVIHPASLGRESATALAESLFGLHPDEDFATALCEASGGNPLYLAAILDAVAREGMTPTAEQASRLVELGGEALARGVSLRLSQLSTEAVTLIRAAAILGDQTHLALAASLAHLDATIALDAASSLVDADLLGQESPIAFSHPIVRSAVLEDMQAGERMRLHRRAAEILLESGAGPEQAATYLMPTVPNRDGFVVATLRSAAQRSLVQGAPEAAVSYLRRALEEPPGTQERRSVLGELGMAENATWDIADAVTHLYQALAEFDEVTARPDLVLAYVYALTNLGSRARDAVELTQTLRARSLEDRELNERLDAYLIDSASWDGDLYSIAREVWEAASARDRDEPMQAGFLLATGALEEARRGVSRARAVELARRAVASDILATPDRHFLLAAAYALSLAGEVELAGAAVDTVIDHASREGDRYSAAVNQLWRAGVLRSEQGELLAAEEDLSIAEVLSIPDVAAMRTYRAGYVADVLVPRGKSAEAEKLLTTVRLDEVQPGHRNPYLCGRGRLYLETGRPEHALADFRAAGEIAKSLGTENPAYCPWRSHAALALHRLHRVDEALELAREELELSRRWGAPRALGVSLRALGLVEGGPAGERLLREAVDVLADSPARLEHARALIDLGAALRRANSRTEARKHLREGVDLAHRCGASVLVERGNDELAATGAHPRKVMLSGLESLTASERRVAQMAAEDVSNKEIAQALFVTVKTVEVHLSRVYRKLDIQSRRELAGALSAPAAKATATT
jgi:DNA-binding CsgD family transcriptional regulator